MTSYTSWRRWTEQQTEQKETGQLKITYLEIMVNTDVQAGVVLVETDSSQGEYC